MTPDSPSPSDTPIPPSKQRMGGSAEFSEDDLWNLEDSPLSDSEGEPPARIPQEPITPKPIRSAAADVSDPIALPPPPPKPSIIRRISKVDMHRRKSGPSPVSEPSSPAAMEPDFESLDEEDSGIGTGVSSAAADGPGPVPGGQTVLPPRGAGGQPKVMRHLSSADLHSEVRHSEAVERPARPSPAAMEAAFDDLDDLDDWGLDEDPAAPEAAAAPETVSGPEQAAGPTPESEPNPKEPKEREERHRRVRAAELDLMDLSEIPDMPGVPDVPDEEEPAPQPGAEAKADEAPAPEKKSAGEVKDIRDQLDLKSGSENKMRPPQAGKRFSGLEKAGLGLLAALLLGGGVWSFIRASSSMVAARIDSGTPLPAKGEVLTVTRVNSYWREPVASGENRESVRLNVTLIPVAEITLSGNGTVRALTRWTG